MPVLGWPEWVVGSEEGIYGIDMVKKPFAKPSIVRRKEKLATIVQFTSGGALPPRSTKKSKER